LVVEKIVRLKTPKIKLLVLILIGSGLLVSGCLFQVKTEKNFLTAEENTDRMELVKTEGPVKAYAPTKLIPVKGNSLNDTVTLAFAGDVMLARGVEPLISKYSPAWIFEKVRPVWEKSDFVMLNLESPVSDFGIPFSDKAVLFKARPRSLDSLSLGGVGLVSLANNHILDYGPEAAMRTKAELQKRGILSVGLRPVSLEKSADLKWIEIKNHKIAVLAYCQVCPDDFRNRGLLHTPPPALPRLISKDIKSARSAGAEWIVILMHWGREYYGVDSDQIRLAEHLAQAGADLVIGAHAHVLQKIDYIGKTLIAYNLGNFVFDLQREITLESAVLLVDLVKGNKPEFRIQAVRLEKHRPVPVAKDSLTAFRVDYILKNGMEFNAGQNFPDIDYEVK
jgi:poly-gamma-glutamate capsule biosynthesis protein CapA/YwtB (metallophosphatase superfamily)